MAHVTPTPQTTLADAGWRKAMPDLARKASALAEVLTAAKLEVAGVAAADIVRRQQHLIDGREAMLKMEERAAWDQYAAAALGVGVVTAQSAATVADVADAMLAERRRRLGQL